MIMLLLVYLIAFALTAGLVPVAYGLSPYSMERLQLRGAERFLLHVIALYPIAYILLLSILGPTLDLYIPDPNYSFSFFAFNFGQMILALIGVAVSRHLMCYNKWYRILWVINLLIASIYMLLAFVMMVEYNG